MGGTRKDQPTPSWADGHLGVDNALAKESAVVMAAWLKEHKDQISAATALVGVLAAIIGFGFTGCQMMQTAAALRAGNSYTIQKDARELVEKNDEIPDFQKSISANTATSIDPTIETGLWRMFNLYTAVYRQGAADGLPKSFAESWQKDFCSFVRLPTVESSWKKMISSGRIGPDQQKMRWEWCGD